jgi:uncharacterized protein
MDELDDNQITIYKLNHRGEEVWHYEGEVLERSPQHVCIEARFVGRSPEVDLGVVVFRRGDLMTEWFFSDRWYNVFRLRDGVTGAFKGWYCNVARPAQLSEEVITQEDLALDVFISPDGAVSILDEDEFDALDLSHEERDHAVQAVHDLRDLASRRIPPFD